MHDLQGVADTLFIPLVARIHVSRRFPEYFYDEKALSLENFVPGDGIRKSSSEYMRLIHRGVLISPNYRFTPRGMWGRLA